MRILWGIILGGLLAAGGVAGYFFVTQNKELTIADVSDVPVSLATFDDRSYFANLRTASVNTDRSIETDIPALVAAMPEWVTITHGDIRTEATTNAIIVDDIQMTFFDEEKTGLKIDEARFSAFDTSALIARMNGDRLDETFTLFKRAQFKGVSSFGLSDGVQALMKTQTDLTKKIASNFLSNTANETVIQQVSQVVEQASDQEIESYSLSIDDIVISNMALNPWVLTLIETAEPEVEPQTAPAEVIELIIPDGQDGVSVESMPIPAPQSAVNGEDVLHFFQTVAAINRAISYDDFAYYNLVMGYRSIDYTGQPVTMTYTIPVTGIKDFVAGDMGFMAMHDYVVQMNQSIPLDQNFADDGTVLPPSKFYPINVTQRTDSMRVTSLNLSKLYDHLARGVFPDKSITDLMGLGYWLTENERYSLNEKPLTRMASSVADLRGFHGIIPAKWRFDVEDFAVNIDTILDATEEAIAGAGEAEGEGQEALQIMADVKQLLADNDLLEPEMDLDLGWDWKPATGAYLADKGFSIRDFIQIDGDVDMVMPTYDALMAHISGEMNEEDWQAVGDAVSQAFAFNRGKISFTDRGGIAKSFALAVGLADLDPDDPSLSMLRGAKPDDLRVTTATTLRLSAGQAGQVFPEARDYILAVADFISKGGVLTAAWDPEVPVTSAMLAKAAEDGTLSKPDGLIKLYGFSLKQRGSGTNE